VAYITGRSFFPSLVAKPFAHGLHLALTFGAICSFIGVIACLLMGKRYVHAEEPEMAPLPATEQISARPGA
jgi:hypothetical protein